MTDTRDQETYVVRKLADGNCWMVQNLRLGKKDGTYTLTPADTNITSNYVLPMAQEGGSGAWAIDSKNSTNEEHVYITGDYSIGNLYNWYTGTARTGLSTLISTDVEESICPRGWILPSSYSNGGANTKTKRYDVLYYLAGGQDNSSGNPTTQDTTVRAKLMAAPYDFIYTGYYRGYNSNPTSYPLEYTDATTAGRYLTSRSANVNIANGIFEIKSTNFVVSAYGFGNKSNGYAIRCVSE